MMEQTCPSPTSVPAPFNNRGSQEEFPLQASGAVSLPKGRVGLGLALAAGRGPWGSWRLAAVTRPAQAAAGAAPFHLPSQEEGPLGKWVSPRARQGRPFPASPPALPPASGLGSSRAVSLERPRPGLGRRVPAPRRCARRCPCPRGRRPAARCPPPPRPPFPASAGPPSRWQ